MFFKGFGTILRNWAHKGRKALRAFDRRHLWVKYLIVFAYFSVSTLFFGEHTVMGYWENYQRQQTLNQEIKRIEPQFKRDSAYLERLKGLGAEVEVIAREKYLMKSPGEEIFIIKMDTTKLNEE